MKPILASVVLIILASDSLAQISSLPSNDMLIRQRLGASIAGLVVENVRLAVELDAARETIKQLQDEIAKLREQRK